MTRESSVPEPLPSGYVLHERYTIESELAQQGMGRLYKACCTLADGQHVVAINVLALELRTATGVARFRRAFREAFKKRRGHVYEYGEYLGVPYAVVGWGAEGTPFDEGEES